MLTVAAVGNIGITMPSDLTVQLGRRQRDDQPRGSSVTYKHQFLLLGPMLGLIGGNWGNSINIVGHIADAAGSSGHPAAEGLE